MKTDRVLTFLAGALLVALALSGPAAASPARPNDGTDGPSRVDADGFADEVLDDPGEFDPPPPPPSTTLPPPPPPEDPFDRPTAPGGDLVLDPGPRGGGDDPTDPADSDDGSTDPPSGSGRGSSGGTPDRRASQEADGADTAGTETSADATVDEQAAAEVDAAEATDDGRGPIAMMAVLGVALLGVGALVVMVRRKA